MLRPIAITTLLIFSLFGRTAACGADDTVRFDSYTWDFGSIRELDGIVSHTFVLTNATSDSLLIANAVPSCSCTLVTYPKNPIAPNGQGEIEVSFTPSGTAGKVYRDIQVYGRNNAPITTLEISADVIPADRTIPERYPFMLSQYLYANLNNVAFGYVYHATEQQKVIHLANSSFTPLHLSAPNSNPLLSVRCPEILAPGAEEDMTLTYHTPDDSALYTFISDTLFLEVNGKRALNPITTSMIALPMLKPQATAPAMRTYPSAPALKRKGKHYVAKTEIANDGNEDLIVQAIQLPSFATASLPSGTRIAKGEKAILEIRSTSKEDFTLRIFTNDPQRQMKEVWIQVATQYSK